jgi:OPT family oligopeptide transporter
MLRDDAWMWCRAVSIGSLLSALLAATNAYLGLFAGLTVSASIPACVLATGVLRMLFWAKFTKRYRSLAAAPRRLRELRMREANLIQTAASAGEALAAGVVFTFPAVAMAASINSSSGVKTHAFASENGQFYDYFRVTTVCVAGGLLGVAFSVPLRRALVRDPRLPFPEGRATAAVLRIGFAVPALAAGEEEEEEEEGNGNFGAPGDDGGVPPVVALDDDEDDDGGVVGDKNSDREEGSGWRRGSPPSRSSSYASGSSPPLRAPSDATAKREKSSSRGFHALLLGAVIGALSKAGESGLRIWTSQVAVALRTADTILFYSGFSISAALVGVGFIVGLNISALVFLGGLANWWIVLPIVASTHPFADDASNETGAPDDIHAVHNQPADSEARMVWSEFTRYLGVGAMLVGGLWTLFAIRRELKASSIILLKQCCSCVPRLLAKRRAAAGGDESSYVDEYESSSSAEDDTIAVGEGERDHVATAGRARELSGRWVGAVAVLCSIPLFVVFVLYTQRPGIAILMVFFVLLCGALFSAVAGYMAGTVFDSHSREPLFFPFLLRFLLACFAHRN